MDTKWIATIAVAVALIVGGVAGWAIGANTGNGHMMDGSGGAMMDGVSETHHGMMAMNEKTFLAAMIAHHEGAIEMAQAEVDAGKDPEVKAVARRVITAQRAEIAEMRRMYGGEVPKMDTNTMGSMSMMGMAGMDSTAIRDSANPDQEFLRMMIPHHAGALMMADMVLNGTPSDEVAKLANTIIADQAAEIAEMQELRTTP
jgi:uncharacterized protein (DUF305 family)